MNLFNLDDLSNKQILKMIKNALLIKKGDLDITKSNKKIGLVFYEPSTRTHYSFKMAAYNLGMEVIDINTSNSSILKGESLYDTAKTLEMMGVDGLVIRDSQKQYYKQLSGLNIPVINGGDGSGEHPSQVLLDLMTIYERFGYFEGLKVMICGDILHSRVARSNFKMLVRLGCDVVLSAPVGLEAQYGEYVDFETQVVDVDVCMMLRKQRERHDGSFGEVSCLTFNLVKNMKDHAIIMHPGPFNRGVELEDDVVECDRSVIWEQVKNGVYMRMVILDECIK